MAGHGGARPGAGRPPVGSERMDQITIQLPGALLGRVEELAIRSGLSRSAAISQLLAVACKGIRKIPPPAHTRPRKTR